MAKTIGPGPFGGGALKRFGKTLDFKRITGKVHINPIQEKEIINRATKIFGDANTISGRELEKQVLNPLAMKHVHNFDSKKAGEIEKLFNLTDHTKQVGYKYNTAIKQEKFAAEQARLNEMKGSEIKEAASEKNVNRFSRLNNMLDSIKDKRVGTGDMVYDEHLGRMVPISKTPEQKAHDLHHGGVSEHGAPSVPPSSIDK